MLSFETSVQRDLAALIERVADSSAVLLSNNDSLIRAVAPISNSGRNVLSFSNATLHRTLEKFELPDDAIIAVKKSDLDKPEQMPVGVVAVDNPRRWFFQAVKLLCGDPERNQSGISNLSVIEDGVKLGKNVTIGPFVSIHKGSVVGDNVVIQHGTMVTARSNIGSDTLIRANSVIGVPGQALERRDDDKQLLLPHLGSVHIEAGCIIGALSVIVAGSMDNTVIGEGCMIGNQVNIGHNCKIGKNCFIAPQTIIAGSVQMGNRCWIAPGVKILNKMRIGDNAMIGLGSVVMKPVKANGYVVGNPASPVRKINKYNN